MSDIFEQYMNETDAEEKTRRPLGTEMQCKNCIFWSLEEWKEEKKLLDPEADFPNIWGECHRHAPVPSSETLTKIGNLLGSIAWAVEETANIEHSKLTPYDFDGKREGREEIWFWPKTQPYSWCGEFKAGRQSMTEVTIAKFEKMYEEWMNDKSSDLNEKGATVDNQKEGQNE